MTDHAEQATALSDRSLLRRFRAGEEDAATALYLRYAKRLGGLAKQQTGAGLQTRFDPDDVVQSVFRTFFRRASAGFYDVPEGEELWRLLLVLALHKIRDLATFHRAKKRDIGKTQLVDERDQLQQNLAIDDQVAFDSLKMVVQEVVQELPEANRQMIELRIEGYEIKEIATRTKRSNRTVERTLQSFRQQLAKRIGVE